MKPTTAKAERMLFDGRYRVVSLMVALALLTAVVLKEYNLATEGVAGGGLLDSCWFSIAPVENGAFPRPLARGGRLALAGLGGQI